MQARDFAAPDKERVLATIDRWIPEEGPLLPILHEVQEDLGFIPDEALVIIADKLNLSRAEVHGVMSFYHDFRKEPAGRHVLKLCRSEACQSMGADGLIDAARRLLGIDFHETTADGAVTLEPVYCLGLCSCAPAAMMDGDVHARLDAERLATLIGEARP
ncbi:MAG: formate dehydrogenase subunit gamma [Stappia sp.]|uniref:formate dehydrogenase subunit gamma n=1 Tax=Stappia sp. TaxID=1870903 RepID=UPI000C50C6FC|nr:formate dehydrogenase subunit gamma [Stappia sp.]MAA97725.1 formate dehydrogenase subunit gamma [Stappia sp.]MBM20659.1 formate dehydrogenase subunit gamma [Stappia sp.]